MSDENSNVMSDDVKSGERSKLEAVVKHDICGVVCIHM